jgi:NADPH:quinone reductase-like Zn-dependent oxidoreductase
MRAARLHEIAGPENLRVEEVPQPRPGPGEISVRIACAALNRRDLYITQGLYPAITLPCTLGSDGAGTVAELGEGVDGPAPGRRVVIDPQLGWDEDPRILNRDGGIVGMPRDGTFAEYVIVPASNVYPAPSHLTDAEAAALPLAGLTAYRAAFTRGRLVPQDTVLITGIGGGVQTFVLLFAKHAGARTIVTSGSDEKLARAKALGADVAINYKTSPAWHKEVRDASQGGPTLIVDSAGGETLARALEIARIGARIVIYGGTTGNATIRPFPIFWKHLSLLGTTMGSPADFSGMLRLIDEARLRPAVDRVYPLEGILDAAHRMLDAQQFGKVVLAVDNAASTPVNAT